MTILCLHTLQLALNKANFQRKDRDDALIETYTYMAERRILRQQEAERAKEGNRAPKTNDRQCNPLVALQATTGAGKSLFEDELGALRLADLELCTDPETKSVLQNSVAVAITYNAGSPFNKRVDAQDPEAGLALRALHRYCI